MKKNNLLQKIPEISIISAISTNNIIGINGSIPWNIPEDMRYFKSLTKGNTVIMGRKTFESIGKCLDNRINIVVSSKLSSDTYRDDKTKGVIFVNNLEKAIKIGSVFEKSIFLIGGYEIYREGLIYADTLYITRVNKTIDWNATNDVITMFPIIDFDKWKKKSSTKGTNCDNADVDYTFDVYKKKKEVKKIKFFK